MLRIRSLVGFGHLVEQIRFQANAVISESQPKALFKEK